MADIRNLLAQERQARRIAHPHASYTKSGILSCSVCHLNIKAESLWEGHLKSSNHRKNVQRASEPTTKNLKRKIEDVDEAQSQDREYEVDGRKKPKAKTTQETEPTRSTEQLEVPTSTSVAAPATSVESPPQTQTQDIPERIVVDVDEDEWAAFEQDVAPLARPDYSGAVISAAPVSAATLAAETEKEMKKLRDTEAEEEKEDEGRRMEEEFDVMEEMEERVRRLKERREALRQSGKAEIDTGQSSSTGFAADVPTHTHGIQHKGDDDHEEDVAREGEEDAEDEDDYDDWYS